MMRTILAALADMAGARVSLASAELGEQVGRQKHALMLGVLVATFACSGLLLATILVVVAFWDTHRVAALGALTLIHLACSAAAYAALRKDAALRAREKRLLILRSTLAQLKVQVAVERIARSPAMILAASITRFGRGMLRFRDDVSHRTRASSRAAIK